MLRSRLLAALLLCSAASHAVADTTAQSLPFTQNWSNTALITANDDWSGVPGITGYLGDIDAGTTTGIDPQTLLNDYASLSAIDVIANQSNPNTNTSGGVGEFDGITDAVVAFQGSGAADAPHLLIFLNTTGRQNIRVRYNARDIDGSADNSVQPVALHYRVGNAGNYTNVPTAFIADASTGPSLATQVTPVDVTLPPAANNQALVILRVMTSNAGGSDEWIGIDDIQVTGDPLSGLPTISINDVSVAEGNTPGQTSQATFTVSLSAPAPAGGSSFNIATSDGSATLANNDYQALSLSGESIAAGQTSKQFTVLVNHDNNGEPNESFNLTLSNLGNVEPGDLIGVGTIQNDDPVEIFTIQGSGTSSGFVGQSVITNGNVVTARASNGFFMQTPNARDDNVLATSNGIFVFTGSAPTVQVGDVVDVSGTVQEFFDSTQINTPTVTILQSGQPLPTAVVFDAARPSIDPLAPSCFANANPEFANFECFENMLISVPTGSVNAPSQRFASDTMAEAVVNARPARSLRGVGLTFPGYAGIAPSIPLWFGNPHLFELDVDRLGLPNRPMIGGESFSAVGILGYEFSDYELYPTQLTITQAINLPVAAPAPSSNTQLSIASINLLRFYNPTTADNQVTKCDGTVNYTDVIANDEYARKLAKTSSYIRNVLRAPDVIAVQEVEGIAVLNDLAARITLDDAALVYTARLEEGNDVGGIDVGYLIRADRVNNIVITQLDKNLRLSVDNSCLHDRPPLRLTANLIAGNRPFAVIVNHTRSFNGVTDCRLAGDPARLCTKRLEQASAIATQVQSFQTSNPSTPLVVIGDHNAFEFTDGHVDVLGIIQGSARLAGNPTPDSQVAPATDIVEPNLLNALTFLGSNQRYSFIFSGTPQALDHALVSAAGANEVRGVFYPRANADAPEQFRLDDLFVNGFEPGNAMSPVGISDHDGIVLRLFD